ncbi:MAG: UDP-N-acetylmuramoyl-L-alanyl-D-glutamate--2,6-diaminopimelate ligase [Clostridia bacterium]|nr:UDP-N-acetylmuramoyl-L-alanyl-D-glutamate--2,6-diaminopimelate ligase [Clostridia bacterium]
MRLETLCFLSGLEPPTDSDDGAMEITAVVCNSRACVPGCIYVCISGTRADGHAFIEEALARGAAAVVTERNHPMADGFVEKRSSAIFLSSSNTRITAARLYNAWYANPAEEMRLIAVTGTNGKTTVSSMLCAMLEAAGVETGLIGTVGCRCRGRMLDIRAADLCANMTTPDPEQLYHILAVMAREGVRVVVMETTSHALALHKLEPLRFDTAIFTNFTEDHLDFHGSMEAYFEAKASLLPKASRVILNLDDAAIASLKERASGLTVTVSTMGADADYLAEDIAYQGTEGVQYTLRERDGLCEPLFCAVPGAFSVSNTLLAAACARQMGVSCADISKALRDFRGVPGRMERVDCGDKLPFRAFIDYAHTPDALEKLLLCARDFRQDGQRIVLLFGCGGDRDRAKRPIMAKIAARYADVIYLTSDNSRSEDPEDILDDISRGIPDGVEYIRIVDRAVAITHAMMHAMPGDIILLAGKGHERYEIDRTGRHPFDERAIARAAVAGCSSENPGRMNFEN